jgi:hypothetical protein
MKFSSLNLCNWKITSLLSSLLTEKINGNSNGSYILDTFQSKFSFIEKFVYDITMFHLNRLGKKIDGEK